MKRHFNCKLTIEQEQEVVRLYQEGKTQRYLMSLFDVGRKVIGGALDRQGISHTREDYANRLKALTPEQEKRMCNLYQDGHSFSELKTLFGLGSTKTAYKIILRNGVTPRENRTYHFNQAAFDSIDDEHTHYWLGFCYADGTTSTGALRIGLARKDREQLEKIRIFMNGDMPISEYTETCVSIEFHSIHLDKQLMDKGIIPYRGKFDLTETHIKKEHENHFVRGYLDGDGCISVNEQVVFLGQIDILSWIRDTLHKECNASLNTIRPRPGIHEISWGGIHQARRIVEYLYRNATIWMQRKRLIAENWRK